MQEALTPKRPSEVSVRLRALEPPSALLIYTASLCAAAAATAVVLALLGYDLGNPWAVLILAVVAAIAERGSVRITATTEVSISLVPTLFAAVLFGPLAALVVAAVSMLPDIRSAADRPYLRWATYTASRSLIGAIAGVVGFAGREAISSEIGGIVIATALAAVAAESLDIGFAAVMRRLRGNGPMLESVLTVGPLALASVPLYAPIVAFLVIAYRDISPWTLPLFLAPALAAQRLYVLYHGQRELTQDVLQANQRLERANLSFATALVATLDARDRYTAGHSAAVAVYARDIATRMGLSEQEQRLAHLCGLVHDMGKIGLPAGLLEKRGPLTLAERRVMEKHCIIGERILRKVEDYAEIASIVRHHHERVDGQGYPDGLRGVEIPVIARIIAVADAYDAMTSDRPYRDAMPSRVARLRLAQAVESQFDTAVVAAFEAILAGAGDEYASGSRFDFRAEAEEATGLARAAVSAVAH